MEGESLEYFQVLGGWLEISVSLIGWLLSAFFNSELWLAMVAALSAIFGVFFQKWVEEERRKLNVINKWLMAADDVMQTLIGVKSNYHGRLTEIPLQRLVSVPPLRNNVRPVWDTYEELLFISPTQLKDGSVVKWSQVPRIRTIFHNYNLLVLLWDRRTELKAELLAKLSAAHNGEASGVVSIESMQTLIGGVKTSELFQLTEQCIRLTDGLVIDSRDFLKEFPSYAEKLVSKVATARYGKVVKFLMESNAMLDSVLVRSPKADYASIAWMYGMTPEQFDKSLDFGYG